MAYDPTEQDIIIAVFSEMLRSVTRDGGRKRERGEKPPWWKDDGHVPAIFSHLNKIMHGEMVDKDSGVDPYFHLGWRAIAAGYRRTFGDLDPEKLCLACGEPIWKTPDHSRCRGTA